MTRVERRDPDATYHRMTPAELKTLTPNFSWEAYFHDAGAPAGAAVNIGQPKFFEALDKELTSVPLPEWKTYLRWHLVNSAAPSLSSKFVEEDFNFNQRTLQGTKEVQPRWKRCVQSADRNLGFALGKLYVAENFPPEAKARADQMVKNLIAALREDLATLPWMGAETRKAALAKLDAFTPKIGYPDKWRDYSPYKVERGAYLVNVMNGALFEHHRDMNKIGRPVDRTEWGMTPPTVNAYYNASRNEIVFPAGILQPPFFDAAADDAVNYGGIGAVIGHEMTHGFDDQGRKFDAQGNLKNWWTADDLKNYQERSNCVEKQFDGVRRRGRPAPERQARAGRVHRGPGRPDDRLQGLPKEPGRQAAAVRHRRVHAGAAPLPELGESVGDQCPSRVRAFADQHEPPPARALPRDRGAVEHPRVRRGVRLQSGRPDGAHGPLPHLVSARIGARPIPRGTTIADPPKRREFSAWS